MQVLVTFETFHVIKFLERESARVVLVWFLRELDRQIGRPKLALDCFRIESWLDSWLLSLKPVAFGLFDIAHRF